MTSFFSNIGNTIKDCLGLTDISNEVTTIDSSLIAKTDNSNISIPKPQLPEKCEDNMIENGKYGLLSTLYKNYPLTMLMILILHILISVCAMVLSWECNRMSNGILRLIVTVVATIFSEFYIMYYAIYHIIMGFQCYVAAPVGTSVARVSLPPL